MEDVTTIVSKILLLHFRFIQKENKLNWNYPILIFDAGFNGDTGHLNLLPQVEFEIFLYLYPHLRFFLLKVKFLDLQFEKLHFWYKNRPRNLRNQLDWYFLTTKLNLFQILVFQPA